MSHIPEASVKTYAQTRRRRPGESDAAYRARLEHLAGLWRKGGHQPPAELIRDISALRPRR